MSSKIVLIVLLFTQILSAQTNDIIIKKVMLGEDSVLIQIQNPTSERFIFVHVHENEESALEAAQHLLPQTQAKLITLIHSFDGTKNRNITFKHKETTYLIDPNRIYTSDEEVLKSKIYVIEGAGIVDNEVIDMVKFLAQSIWDEMANFDFIVAVHNNKNEAAQIVHEGWFSRRIEPASFSVVSYIQRNDITSDSNLSCSDIYINPAINESEFFIVNQKSDFDMLMKKRYSVVLQNDEPVDDGSLSVFSSKYKKRYVNAEAKMGRVEEQIKMLSILLNLE